MSESSPQAYRLDETVEMDFHRDSESDSASDSPDPDPTPSSTFFSPPSTAPSTSQARARALRVKEEFRYLRDEILGLEPTDPGYLALKENGIETSTDLLRLSKDEIKEFTYTLYDSEKNQFVKRLNAGQYGAINTIVQFVGYMRWNKYEDIFSYTYEQFHHFSTDPTLMAPTRTSDKPDSVVNQPRAPKGSLSRDPVAELKKTIKLDASAYSPLKSDLFFDNWHRSFVATAKAHDLADVINTSYKPRNPTDAAKFQVRQNFLYSVLDKNIQTEVGRRIVRKHQTNSDAQKVYAELKEYYFGSTFARTNARTILKYLVRTTIDSHWKGTTQGFILHFQEQVRQYRQLKDSDGALGDPIVYELLQHAVSSIPDLRAVEVTATVTAQKDGKELEYEDYCNLLLSAAIVYDDETVVKKQPRRLAHSSYVTDEILQDVHEDSGESFTIDTPLSVIQAFASHQARPRPPRDASSANTRIPDNVWKTLSREDQQAWMQLSSAGKAAILASSPAPRSVNLHEMSAHDYLQSYQHQSVPMGSVSHVVPPVVMAPPPILPSQHAYVSHQSSLNPNPQLALVPHTPSTPEFQPSTSQVHQSQQSTTASQETVPMANPPITAAHPGQLGQMLGAPNAPNPHHTRHANLHQSSNLFRVNVSRTIVVSRFSTTPNVSQSLVDRGANAGVAGNDVRLMHTTHRKVNIQGIDNHQMTDIPVGTVAGLAETQFGHAILIFHQYAYTGRGNTIHSPAQLECFGNDVNDKSLRVTSGKQRIKTPDGYILPLNIVEGLARLNMCIPSDADMEKYPHIVMTAEAEWDPTIMDHILTDDENWFDALEEELAVDPHINRFTETGDYRHRVAAKHEQYFMDAASDLYGEHMYGFANDDPYLAPPIEPDLDPKDAPYLLDSDVSDDESVDRMLDTCLYRAHASINRPPETPTTPDNVEEEKTVQSED